MNLCSVPSEATCLDAAPAVVPANPENAGPASPARSVDSAESEDAEKPSPAPADMDTASGPTASPAIPPCPITVPGTKKRSSLDDDVAEEMDATKKVKVIA